MFGSKETPEHGEKKTPHRMIEVETIDNTETHAFEEGGAEVGFIFSNGILEVTKTDGLKVFYPVVNLVRVEDFLEQ